MAILVRGGLRWLGCVVCGVIAVGCTGLDHSNAKGDDGGDHGGGRDAGTQVDHARPSDGGGGSRGSDGGDPRSHGDAALPPDASGGNGGARSDAGDAGTTDQDAGSAGAIAAVGSSCSGELARACSGHDTLDKLICDQGTWRSSGASCDGDNRCDTQLGLTQGTCQAIATMCVGQDPGAEVCDGAVRKRCDADLLRYEADDCPAHASCAENDGVHCACDDGYEDDDHGGCADVDDCAGDPCGASENVCTDAVSGYSCECASGYTGSGTTACADIDECTSDPPVCDALTVCGNTPGGFSCSPCPIGYRGSGETGCIPLWTQQLGSSQEDAAWGVCVDAGGNVIAAGSTAGDFDGHTSAGLGNLIVVKYGANAQKTWSRQLGSGAGDAATAVAVDAAGNIYVGGNTSGNLNLEQNAGSFDTFIVKYDGAGQRQWTRLLGSSELELTGGIATDPSGNVYVDGWTPGVVGAASAGGNDLYVAKYDSDGVQKWVRQLGSSGGDGAYGIATDENANVYLAASTTGMIDGNPNAGASDLLLVKYDTAGTEKWSRQLGTAMEEVGNGVAVDGSGDVLVAGSTSGDCDGHTSAGGRDLLVAKYDSTGEKQWSAQLGSSAEDTGAAVATDSHGNVYVTGSTSGDFDGHTHAGVSYDLFLVKYDSAGQKQWSRQFGTSADDRARAVAVDGSDNVFVAGSTEGSLDGHASAGKADLFIVKYDGSGNRL